MIKFTTTILKFNKRGEKTGWSYILIPQKKAQQLNPGVKKSFRVKGKFDAYSFDAMTLLPMGDGDFIIALKTDIRRAIKKRAGDRLKVELALQPKVYELNADFVACLEDEPKANTFFNSLNTSHRNYFSKWIDSAKTEETRSKRIAICVNALAKKMDYRQMIRAQQQKRKDLSDF
jgi:hypothetical protein